MILLVRDLIFHIYMGNDEQIVIHIFKICDDCMFYNA